MNKTYSSLLGFEQFVELKDYSPSTKREYLRAVRQCARHFQCDPARLSEDQIRQYFLFLRQERSLGASSMRVAKCGLRAFFRHHLRTGLSWSVFEDLRIRPDQSLPLVLSDEEVGRIFKHLKQPRFRTCLRLIYHTGLRISEAVAIRVQDFRDGKSDHPQLHVRMGKGGKDRCVPLSPGMMEELRLWWRQHQHRTYLFPSPGRGQVTAGWLPQTLNRASLPMSKVSVQHAFHLALQISGIDKPATVHTLRHSYATRLLEAGISIRQIAQYLGHKSLDTTLIYTHLTTASEARTRAVLDRFYQRLGS